MEPGVMNDTRRKNGGKMIEDTRVFEIRKIVRVQEAKETFILEFDKDKKQWVFRTPASSEWTAEVLEMVLDKLNELNESEKITK